MRGRNCRATVKDDDADECARSSFLPPYNRAYGRSCCATREDNDADECAWSSFLSPYNRACGRSYCATREDNDADECVRSSFFAMYERKMLDDSVHKYALCTRANSRKKTVTSESLSNGE